MILFFKCLKILGEAGKQEILQQMFRNFFISHLLPNRYFPKIDVGCPWKELSMRRCPTILGDPGAVRRVDKMFVAKVYSKIDLTVNFHHEHFIDSTNCPWVSEDDVHLDSLWKQGLRYNDLYILQQYPSRRFVFLPFTEHFEAEKFWGG